MDWNKFLLNTMLIIANLILIFLCFEIAIIKNWWLCLLIPLFYNFSLDKNEENKE